mgnify:CR=1 FL=1|jgi:hypothetical protein
MKPISILLNLTLFPFFLFGFSGIEFDMDSNIEINSHPFAINSVPSDMISTWNIAVRQPINEYSRWVVQANTYQFLNQDVYDNGSLSLLVQFKGKNEIGLKTYSGLQYQTVFLSDSLKNNEVSNFLGYMNLRKDINLSSFVKSGVDGKFSIYSEIPEFTNTSIDYWIGYHKSFQTKTSLQTYLNLGYQNFSQIIEGTSGSRQYSSNDVSDIPSRQIANISAQVSQNLGTYVGGIVRIEKQFRWTSLDDTYGTILVGDNPFLDNYEWEGESYSLKFNIRLPGAFRLTPWMSYQTLDFPDRKIYQYDFELDEYTIVDYAPVLLGVGRENAAKNIGFKLSKSMNYSIENIDVSIRMFTSMSYTSQESNDLLYDYEGRKVEFGISVNP